VFRHDRQVAHQVTVILGLPQRERKAPHNDQMQLTRSAMALLSLEVVDSGAASWGESGHPTPAGRAWMLTAAFCRGYRAIRPSYNPQNTRRLGTCARGQRCFVLSDLELVGLRSSSRVRSYPHSSPQIGLAAARLRRRR
jgi:hypothetical protein